jgi:hypothetical protein
MKSTFAHVSIALGICVLSVAIYAYAYFYVADESARAAELAATIDSKKATVDRASLIRAALLKLGEDEARIKNYFVSEENIGTFVSQLEEIGKSLGTQVDITSVGEGKDAARPVLTVTVRMQGTFDAVLRSIGAIEHASYAITLNSVSVSSAGGDVGSWSATMTLGVGMMKNKPPAQ